MSRKITGIIIILIAAVILGALIYFFMSGYDPQKIMSWLGIGRNKEEIIPVNTEDARQKTDTGGDSGNNEPKRINAADLAGQTEGDEEIEAAPAQPVVRGFGKDDIRRMSASFAERFGTYSNQSNFANVLDLKIFMTRRMQEWADSYVAENRAIPQSADIYYGITTRSVGEEILEFDDDLGIAKVAAQTRRQEARGSRSNVADIFVQKIEIVLKKEAGSWKVDQAFWEDK